MNRYQTLIEKQAKEFNKIPLGFAYSEKQFNEVMSRWNLDPQKDLDKITGLPLDGFIQKKDLPQFKELVKKHRWEMDIAINSDPDGNNFIYEMFYYELCNHEFLLSRELEDTLYALSYTFEDIEKNPKLKAGLEKAKNKILQDETENDNITQMQYQEKALTIDFTIDNKEKHIKGFIDKNGSKWNFDEEISPETFYCMEIALDVFDNEYNKDIFEIISLIILGKEYRTNTATPNQKDHLSVAFKDKIPF